MRLGFFLLGLAGRPGTGGMALLSGAFGFSMVFSVPGGSLFGVAWCFLATMCMRAPLGEVVHEWPLECVHGNTPVQPLLCFLLAMCPHWC